MPDSLITQLHKVLDLEKQALISADFDPLADLLRRKEMLLAKLANSNPRAETLRPARRKMDENQALLAAAIKGVAAAGERLEALNSVQKGLRVYDPTGRIELAQQHSKNLEKKA